MITVSAAIKSELKENLVPRGDFGVNTVISELELYVLYSTFDIEFEKVKL